MNTLFLSHRGESDDAPENTMESFRLAAARQSDGVELDVWTTAAGELVVAHDGNFKRVAGSDLKIMESTLEEIRRVYPVPLLSDVLKELPHTMQLQIEMKAGKGLADALQRVLNMDLFPRKNIVITAFEIESLRMAAKRMPDIPRFYLTDLFEEFGSWLPAVTVAPLCASFGGTGISQLATDRLTKNWIDTVHASGCQVGLWGVRDDALALALADAGVDRMTCNHAVALREKYRLSHSDVQ